jgi:hypothetical protein
VGLLGGTLILVAFERQRHKDLAKGRRALSKYEFISRMAASGVRNDTASFVWTEVTRYYFDPLKPDPSDHWESTIHVDPGDLEEITAKFWKLHRWIEPPRDDPVILSNDPSLLEYGRWLDNQRQFH